MSTYNNNNTNAVVPNNTEQLIADNKTQKKEFISLSNSYSNYLHKSLDKFINSSDESTIDKELVNKITQIHKDEKKIDGQHEKMTMIHKKFLQLSDRLESDLVKSKRYLLKNQLINIDKKDGTITNTLQKKSELIDQDIRILENCVRLLDSESR